MFPPLRSLFRRARRLPAVAVSCLISAGAAAQTPGAGQVCLYEHDDYLGKQLCVGAGNNNLPAGWNDLVSSVRVPQGWKVELLADANFKGRSVVLTLDTPSLGALRANDTTSS